MYVSKNFKTKKEFKEAVKNGEQLTLWTPGLGTPPINGKSYVEAPWYPLPHKWYAEVWVENGIIVKVK